MPSSTAQDAAGKALEHEANDILNGIEALALPPVLRSALEDGSVRSAFAEPAPGAMSPNVEIVCTPRKDTTNDSSDAGDWTVAKPAADEERHPFPHAGS